MPFNPMNVNQDIVKRSYPTDHFDQFLEDFLTEIQSRNYRITRVNHIDNIFDREEAGIEITARFRHYKIIEFCNLNSCSELISGDLLSGVFMPVRFVVYQAEGEENIVCVAFLDPNAFARLFHSPLLSRVADELSRDMTDVFEEMAI